MSRSNRTFATAFAVLATGVAVLAPAAPAAAGAIAPPSTITVSGTGSVHGDPDVMVLNLTLRHREKDAADALARSKEAVARVRDSLKADGVAERDITTTDLDLRNSASKKAGPGYTATQGMLARLRDFDMAGRAISDAAKAAGGQSTVDGAMYAIDDPSALEQSARKAAFANARSKAERYAEASGRPLGQVRSIQEAESPYEKYGYYPGLRTPGAQTVTVRTTTVWELG